MSIENTPTVYPKQNFTDTNLDTSATKTILASLQKLTEGIITLDKRLSSYRSARFLSSVSEIYPKTKTVIFAGGSNFGDNVKYAYLSFLGEANKVGASCYYLPYNSSQYNQLKACGLPCLPDALSEYTPDDIRVCLGAKVLVLDNHFVPHNWKHHLPHSLLRGAKTIQLWHGIPIKEIGLETVATAKIDDPNTVEIMASCGPFDVFVATSAVSQTEWARKFSFNAFSTAGYPRNDVLLRDINASDKINVDTKTLALIEAASKKKQPIVFYAPTFRDKSGGAWFFKAEISKFADYCAKNDYLFFVNMHPAEQETVASFRQRYPEINFVEPYSDVYPLVKHADVLVTDYSSLAFDFLLLDRPIVFYRPDHADYIARSRHLIKNHDQYLCGEVTSALTELTKAIDIAVGVCTKADTDLYRSARQSLRHRLFDYQDAFASRRLNDLIASLLDSAP